MSDMPLSVSELQLINDIINGITNGICCVVDVSGSMAVNAKQERTKSGEETSITRIELLKHALSTMLTLIIKQNENKDNPNDINKNNNNKVPFGIYPFTKGIDVKPLKLQENSITEIENYIKTLEPLQGTKLLNVLTNAISDALKVGLKQVCIITDGLLDDSDDVIMYLWGLHTTNPDFKVHFIALGADVPTETAYLASITGGTYYIIYDVGRTDVVMIDLLTNMGTSFAFSPDNAIDNNNNIIRLSFIEMLNKLIEYIETDVDENDVDEDDDEDYLIGAKKILSDYKTILLRRDLHIPEYVLKELEEGSQLDIITTTDDAYDKWGKHHIMCLISALTNMNITISIDSSPILKLFETEERTQLMKMFEERILNNPQFAVKLEQVQEVSDGRARATPNALSASTASTASTPIALVSSAYYNISGCFVADMPVKIVNLLTGEIIQTTAGEIKKGDDVVVGYDAVGNPITSRILCVIILTKWSGTLHNGLTPYHPIQLIDKDCNITYIFAKDMLNAIIESVEDYPVYDFLFEKGNIGYFISSLNGIDVKILTLGHGITDNPVAKHTYFDNWDANNNSAKQHPGYITGLINSSNPKYKYENENNILLRQIIQITY